MASFDLDRTSGRYHIRFRYGNLPFKRSLQLADDREAERVCGVVEETIKDLKRGRLSMPPDAEPGAFLLSGGKNSGKLTVTPRVAMTLGELFDFYKSKIIGKDPSTRYTEDIHEVHLLRILGEKTLVESITLATVEVYITTRGKEIYCGRKISAPTILKEIKTLRIIWNWVSARSDGVPKHIPFSVSDMQFEKETPKQPFRTWVEIEQVIKRGGLSAAEEAELWDCLYLTKKEVQEVLAYSQVNGARPFLHPMLVAAAYTGARRSELCRSRIDDWDLEAGAIQIRQKKQDHAKTFTFRHVELASTLSDLMRDWFSRHPGGQFAFCHEDGTPVRPDSASYYLGETLANSKWSKLKGWHTFRHSFASNLACQGTDQRMIDAWMGHSTDIRLRYQHLFPKNRKDAIERLIG